MVIQAAVFFMYVVLRRDPRTQVKSFMGTMAVTSSARKAPLTLLERFRRSLYAQKMRKRPTFSPKTAQGPRTCELFGALDAASPTGHSPREATTRLHGRGRPRAVRPSSLNIGRIRFENARPCAFLTLGGMSGLLHRESGRDLVTLGAALLLHGALGYCVVTTSGELRSATPPPAPALWVDIAPREPKEDSTPPPPPEGRTPAPALTSDVAQPDPSPRNASRVPSAPRELAESPRPAANATPDDFAPGSSLDERSSFSEEIPALDAPATETSADDLPDAPAESWMSSSVGSPGASSGHGPRSHGAGGRGSGGRGFARKTFLKPRDLSRAPIAPDLSDLLSKNHPVAARMHGLEGTVELKAVILPDGTPSALRVESIDPSGRGFGEACIRTVQHGPKWLPGRDRNGAPIAAEVTVTCPFRLGRAPTKTAYDDKN